MLVVLYPSAEFSLPLKGKLLLYTAEGLSVMMGASQRNFLPSVQSTEEFGRGVCFHVQVSPACFPCPSAAFQPFCTAYLSDNCEKR